MVASETSPMTMSHTSRHVARAAADELFVCRQVSGTSLLEQDNRDVALMRGDMALFDPRLPYRARLSSGCNLLVVKVPRRRVEARVG